MKLRIDKLIIRTFLSSILGFIPLSATAQSAVQSNPSQYVIINEANNQINGEISSQTTKETKIALEQNSMGGMYTIMKTWEAKYNSYLKTASGYADALRAGTTLYAEGVQTLQNIYTLKKALNANPEGVAASFGMNNLYMEVTTELIKTYRTLKIAVAMGGSENMLTGAERTEILWTLNDCMERLNKKLRRLAISIAYYNLMDVWRNATAGMTDRSHGEIAREAQNRWRRSMRVYRTLEE